MVLDIMSLLSSKLVNEFFRTCFVDNHIATQYLESIPIRNINFTTSTKTRARLVEEGKRSYEQFIVGKSRLENVLNFVDVQLQQQPESSDVVHDLLTYFAKQITELTQMKYSLNLDILDYLGSHSDGQILADLYLPLSGLAESLLTETAADLDSLRVGSVSLERQDGRLVLFVSARYKPGDPEEYETDRWGYTETDLMPAMEFHGLSEEQMTLIEEFVPVAVDKGSGFAGFRGTATKTMSLIDRLEQLTLPSLDDVRDGLERFIRVKRRARELDEKIRRTDEFIDQIVYRLYGLTEEEIRIVEESVKRD